jgi:hypothetical protein
MKEWHERDLRLFLRTRLALYYSQNYIYCTCSIIYPQWKEYVETIGKCNVTLSEAESVGVGDETLSLRQQVTWWGMLTPPPSVL